MRRQLILFIGVLIHTALLAQTVDLAEWFVGDDPGVGFGNPVIVVPGQTTTLADAISSAALPVGVHRVSLRCRDTRGRWSAPESRLLAISIEEGNRTLQALTAYEYWFDDGPHTLVTAANNDELSLSNLAETSALPPGIHRFHYRAQTDAGQWSAPESRIISVLRPDSGSLTVHNVSTLDYWLDNGPVQTVNLDAGEEVALQSTFGSDSLTPGTHRLYFRTRDDLGRASPPESRLMALVPPPGTVEPRTVSQAEYFLHGDPGIGHGVPMIFPLDSVLDNNIEEFRLFFPHIQLGEYQFGARIRDNLGRWSYTTVDSFAILPDLRVTELNVSPAGSGQPVTLEWTVLNDHLGWTTAPVWHDHVWLSRDLGVSPDSDVLLGEFENQSFLSGHTSYQQIQEILLPDSVAGAAYLIISTDNPDAPVIDTLSESSGSVESGDVAEKNEQNNFRVALLNIQASPAPDLRVSGVVATATAFSGSEIQLQWAVENAGSVAASAERLPDELYLSSDSLHSADDALLQTIARTLNLNPGESVVRTLAQQLPNAIEGPRYVIVKTDADGDIWEHEGEINNSGISNRINVLLAPWPNLQVESSQAPDSASTGSPIPISWRVRNVGAGEPYAQGWFDRVMLMDTTYDPSTAITVGQFTVQSGLEPDSSYDRTEIVTIPHGLSGQYFVAVETDWSGLVFENGLDLDNLSGEVLPLYVRQSPLPNLQVSNIVVPDTIAAGGELNISVTVQNVGDSTAAGSWVDRVYLAEADAWSTEDAELIGARQHSGPLATGLAYTLNISAQVSPLLAGEYHVIVRTDAFSSLYETEEQHSLATSAVFSITPYPPVDLFLSMVDAPATASSGQMITVSYEVQNSGQASPLATGWLDAIYLSRDSAANADSLREIALQLHSEPLAPGGAYHSAIAARIPDGISGQYYLYAMSDADAEVPDVDRANNLRRFASSMNINLTPSCNLRLVSIATSSPDTAGQPLTVRWSVQNQSETPAGLDEWYDAVYLSLNEILDDGDLRIATYQHTGDLLPDSSYSVELEPFTPPFAVGSYNIIVKADHRGDLYEHQSETDNVALAPVQLRVPPPADLIVRDVVIPQGAEPGDRVTVEYVLENAGANPATGWVRNAIYISSDTAWTSSDRMLRYESQHVSLAPGASATMRTTTRLTAMGEEEREAARSDGQGYALEGELPGLTPGDYNMFVRIDLRNSIPEVSESNNMARSGETIQLTVPVLPFDSTAQRTLPPDLALYYQLQAPVGQSISIDLTRVGGNEVVDFFVSVGSMPSPMSFQHYFRLWTTEDSAQVSVPISQDTTYYIMISPANATDTSHVALRGRIMDIAVNRIDPVVGGNSGPLTLEISGASFQYGHRVFLRRNGSGEEIEAAIVKVLDPTRMLATFAMANREPGFFDLCVSSFDSVEHCLTGALQLVQSEPSQYVLTVTAPSGVRSLPFPMNIVVQNTGQNDLPAPTLLLQSSNPGIRYQLPRAGDIADGPNRIVVPELVGGHLRPGQAVSVDVLIHGGVGSFWVRELSQIPLDEMLIPIDWESVRAADSLFYYDPVFAERYWDYLEDSLGGTLADAMEYIQITQDSASRIGISFDAISAIKMVNLQTQYFSEGITDTLSSQRARQAPQLIPLYNGDCSCGVTIIVHGFTDSSDDPWVQDMASALNRCGSPPECPKAVYAYDWRDYASPGVIPDLVTAALFALYLGEDLAEQVRDHGLQSCPIEFIGHSLGAHLSGAASRALGSQSTTRIYALDPAGEPLFGSILPPLSASDAGCVTAIHTSTEFGMNTAVGHGDFYKDWYLDLDRSHKCAFPQAPSNVNPVDRHSEAHQIFTESICNPNGEDWNYGSNGRGCPVGEHPFGNPPRECPDDAPFTCVTAPYTAWCLPFPDVQIPGLQPSATTTFVRSSDPNDMLGPNTVGERRWVQGGIPLPYLIRFENDPDFATAPAQVVTITHSLDSDLNPAAFRLGPFGFGGLAFDVPANRSFYSARLDLRESRGLYVDVLAGINVSTHEAFWQLTSIDPNTGLPPTNPYLGLLPVNDSTGAGEGFVTFNVRPRTPLNSGTRIDSQAEIIFDQNEPIDTPPIFCTLDASPPVSRMDSVIEVLDSTIAVLRWSGEDGQSGEEGAGISSYDLWCSANGDPFLQIATSLPDTQYEFRGQIFNAYDFLVIATDSVGNTEQPKDSGEVHIAFDNLDWTHLVDSLVIHVTTDGVDRIARLTWNSVVDDSIPRDDSAVEYWVYSRTSAGQHNDLFGFVAATNDTVFNYPVPSQAAEPLRLFIVAAHRANPAAGANRRRIVPPEFMRVSTECGTPASTPQMNAVSQDFSTPAAKSANKKPIEATKKIGMK